MKMLKPIGVVMLAALAVLYAVLAACGEDAPARDEWDLAPDSSWQEVFDDLTASEQTCVRNELGEELLASVLERPVLDDDGDTEQWHDSMFICLGEEATLALFFHLLILEVRSIDTEEANKEEAEACLRSLWDDGTISAALSPDASPSENEALRLLACFASLVPVKEPGFGPEPPDGSLLWQYGSGSTNLMTVAPNVVDGIVYAGNYENMVYALNTQTGDVLWSFEAEGYLNPPPTVAGGVAFTKGEHIYALDASTGEVLLSEESRSGSWTLGSDGMIYRISRIDDDESSFSAVDPTSGESLWTTEMPNSEWPSMFPPTAAGSNVYVSRDLDQVHAFDASSGELLWTFTSDEGVQQAPPTIRNGMVYLVSQEGTAYALDESTGEQIWNRRLDSLWSFLVSPVVVDGVWYIVASNALRALDAATGQSLWSFDEVEGQPTVSDGMAFVSGLHGAFYALDTTTGEPVWSIDDEKDWQLNQVLVVDGVLYASDVLYGYLHTRDALTGEPIWSAGIGNAVGGDTPPYAVSGGVVYAGGRDANGNSVIYAYTASRD